MTKKTDDVEAVEKLGKARDAIVSELRKTIVGMDDVIDELMISIFAQWPLPAGGCARSGENAAGQLFG